MAGFDRDYFERFYESRASRVYGMKEISRLARGITELIAWFGGDIETVLDVGAGTGLWRDWFKKHKPGVKYLSTDISEYACKRYGHELRDITTWRSKQKFDFVVCQGVVPYLDDDACAKAIENIAAMSDGFLYLEAITKRDLEEVCDRSKTDITVRPRTGAWYRRQLAQHFVPLGCGLHYVKNGSLAFYELERA